MPAQTGPLQIRRLSSTQLASVTPAVGEPVLDLTNMALKLGDGVTTGGVSLNLVASAVKLANARTVSLTGDAAGTFSFDGTADVSATVTLGATGVTAGTYTRVTVDTKGRVTAGQSSALAIANGGTGATTAAAALSALGGAPLASPTFTGTPAAPTAAVGTSTTQLATTALVQAEIANKRAWTAYTPTVTAASGTYTTISATGKYMVAFGICYVQIVVTVTTKGTGTYPIATLPVAALAGSVNMPLPARQAGATTNYSGFGRIIGSLAAVQFAGYDNSDTSNTGDTLYLNGSYPVA